MSSFSLKWPSGSLKDGVRVSTLDLVVLIDHLIRGAAHPKVGHEHASMSLNQLVTRLNTFTTITLADAEACFYACNMMDEIGEFRHPKKYDLKKFIAKVLKDREFNYMYNYVEEKK